MRFTNYASTLNTPKTRRRRRRRRRKRKRKTNP
jgi:hypothetical protein